MNHRDESNITNNTCLTSPRTMYISSPWGEGHTSCYHRDELNQRTGALRSCTLSSESWNITENESLRIYELFSGSRVILENERCTVILIELS